MAAGGEVSTLVLALAEDMFTQFTISQELEFLSVEDGNTETTGLAGTIEQQNIPRVDSEPSGAASGNTTTNAVAQLFNSAAHPRIAILHVFFKVIV